MKPMPPRSLAVALCAVLVFSAAALRAEQPSVPHVAESPWTGPGTPFEFQDGVGGEKLVKVGNETYWIVTLAKLANNQNPGLAHRNVAIISELGSVQSNDHDRKWTITLTEDPKVKLGHPDRFYEDGLKMLAALRVPDPVMVLGTAEVDGNGSTVLVTKVFRIPNEVARLAQDFELLKGAPDYEGFKAMADMLAVKATIYTTKRDQNSADKLNSLRDDVVTQALTLRKSFFKGGKLSIEEEVEFMKTTIKYVPGDRDAAAEICKEILKKDPDNKEGIEAIHSLMPDWVRCPETKTWMAQADCDKRRQAEQALRDKEREQAHALWLEHMNSVAGMSSERHYALLKNQAMLADGGYKLPAPTDPAWVALSDVLKSSQDYRLVQDLLVQAVTQLASAQWARMIPAVVANPNVDIRILGYRLGAFSNNPKLVLWLAQALIDDKSDALKEDAVLAMCETRTPVVVQGLVRCMEKNRNDDHLNQVLLQQLQKLTGRREADLAAWQKYVLDAAKIEIAPE
ncbi:MAG TPA: hypothetical protein VL860_00410 [Planctomycetota bacterium]|nr:hypothetical protein [Planctomycetota bacterium]